MINFTLKEFLTHTKAITKYYKILVNEAKNKKIAGSTNEWILDNYYLISEQEQSIKEDLKSKEIQNIKPKRKQQLFEILHQSMYRSNFQINTEIQFEDINKYQLENDDYLSYCEVSYVFILFRIILIAELSRLTEQLKKKLEEKKEAEQIIEQISKASKEQRTTIDFDAIFNNGKALSNPYYIEQLNLKIKNFDHLPEDIYKQLTDLIANKEQQLKDLLQTEMEQSAADNILVMNIFVSIKKMSKFKIDDLFEEICFSEQTLMKEKVGMYKKMYNTNKGDYRAQIIRKAKKHNISEYQYTLGIIEQANKAEKHVGWYLFRPKKYKTRSYLYVSIIATVTIIGSALLSLLLGWVAFPLLLIPISQIVIEITNKILFYLHAPHSTFKLDLDEGIPQEYATMVIVPTIVKSREKVKDIFDKLEVYYLSNKSANLYFTLLGDAASESTKHTDYDAEVIDEGFKRVKRLNEKYGKSIFNFVYRQRFYSEGEGCYLGFERKRGAILHFNDLLLGNLDKEKTQQLFQLQTFGSEKPDITYVITLDTDTKLVLYTAFKLVGAMAHPMNRPVFSADGHRVVSGYGIMQPRVNVDVEVTNKSRYAQLFAGLGGLDVYTTASFELYQDIFNEGSFVGKGIYDLRVFQKILSGTFPDNLILSHDLLEGNYIRCGLINDIELVDDSPSNYLDDAKRHHRWTRGDWQIIAWLKSKVKNEKKETVSNPISFLGKWKIFDNLRRSVTSLSVLVLLFYGFVISKTNAWWFLAVAFFVVIVPIFFYLISRLVYKRKYSRYLRYYMNLARGFIVILNKCIIMLSILPKEAMMSLDAIVKALYRMLISHKNLLNWITSEEAEKMTKKTLPSYLSNFKANLIASFLLLLLVCCFKIEAIIPAAIVSIFWLCAPFRMFFLGKPFKDKGKKLSQLERDEIKEVALNTWQYFNTFTIEANNFLVPDNYQSNRSEKTDYKTSPTNIGFSLLSIVCAKELEFIDQREAEEKIEQILTTVKKLKKWEGHLYNWYNIYTLEELQPFFVSTADSGNFVACLYVVKQFLNKTGNTKLLSTVIEIIDQTNFTKLYNHDLDVFSIGYNRMEQRLLPYHYNNFASESRLTSFIAISKGDVPYKHWFCLDKTLTKYKFYKGVASWYGTLFEYFMPLIFMKTFRHTLMDETYSFALYAQKEFIKDIDPQLPWGISESGYHELDDAQNYKYRAFGVPYLKFQNTISNRLVISPYSSLMTISIKDTDVYENMQKFKKLGVYGPYGFYESYDDEDKAVVEAHYAHHQGMILASLTNYLDNNAIEEYFHANKNIQSMEMLLKEKAQIKPYIDLKITQYKRFQYSKIRQENDIREYNTLKVIPEMGVLSNGFYSIIVNDRGTGMSRYKNLYINRYRKITDENYGLFVYVRNINTDKIWSNTFAPLNQTPDNYRVIFASDRIKYVREDDGIITSTEIAVIKDQNAEIRKLTFENTTAKDVRLELTSYGEVIMARNEEDIAHRAFNGITISSEIDTNRQTLLFTRKSRTKENTTYFVANRLLLNNENDLKFEYETSRLHFIGRNNTTRNPKVITQRENLTKTVGAALDPIMSLRKDITIKAGSKESACLILGFGKSREQVMDIIDTYNNSMSIDNAFEMATVLNNMRTSYAQFKGFQMRQYNTMLKYIFQTYPVGEERMKLLRENTLTQNNLWRFGISGDLPIILVTVDAVENALFINDVLKAYEFYKSRAIYLDVVILINEKGDKEEQMLKKYILDLTNKIYYFNYFENSIGNVYTISESDLNPKEIILLHTVARISLQADSNKTLEDQIMDMENDIPDIKDDVNYPFMEGLPEKKPEDIVYYNEFGGFIHNGKEYFINNIDTPTPWSNVIANQQFGFIITNSMSGFTYAINSQRFKLTSWSNDVVGDQAGEIVLIDKQRFKPTSCRHGLGYSVFKLQTNNLLIEIDVFAAVNDMVKYYSIKMRNLTTESKSVDLDFIARIVLGNNEEVNARYIITDWDKETNRLYFSNAYSRDFRDCKAFLSSTETITQINSFKPFHKSISVKIDLDANAETTTAFMIGCENKEQFVPQRNNAQILEQKQLSVDFWNKKIATIQIKTPDIAFDYSINTWLLYQTYAARLYARAGFYQVGGAFGFRDQLQDVMSLSYSDPAYAHQQILRHAAHQFKEGDVLHWWHEELSLGSRTTFSDDYLWLIYVCYEYMTITGDYGILNIDIPYIDGEKLNDKETERGLYFSTSSQSSSLYIHLKRCIEYALSRIGSHGLPLMGCGDWNDGMNKVGCKGKGESVWVAFFLLDLLRKMNEISLYKQDVDFANICSNYIPILSKAIQDNAWNGRWFLRAYFDNGDSLGDRNNTECQIDLLTQSWSLLTSVADENQRRALIYETEARLVDHEYNIIKLLAPPFKNSKNNPGYIMDYLEGIRENGGQYTHAAMWYIMALLKENLVDKAFQYYAMINPINRSKTLSDTLRYKVEPYSMAADIYANPLHAGRGGWTWYTGSSGWAYKTGLEHILGFKKEGETLRMMPKVPSFWSGFKIFYRYMDTDYVIEVVRTEPDSQNTEILGLYLDGKSHKGDAIHLVNDRQKHDIRVEI